MVYAAFPTSSTSFTEKDCWAGLAETQIQDLDPLISKVSKPHSTPMKYHWASGILQRMALAFDFSILELEFGLAQMDIFFSHPTHREGREAH